ncbi:MAG: SCO family protein [Thermodesulfovibrionales bacterium]
MTNRALRNAVAVFSFCLSLLLVAGSTLGQDSPKYKRTVEYYTIPDVTLVDQDGETVALRELLDSEKPVLVDFIFATCTTVCPVLSAGFSNLQKKLGPQAEQVRLVSISIDPDNDRPEIMKQYLERYNAQAGWVFLTGAHDDIVRVMRAFDAYVENKMSHYPLIILHAPGSREWVRIYGMVGTADLVAEYRKLLEK